MPILHILDVMVERRLGKVLGVEINVTQNVYFLLVDLGCEI